MRKLGSVFLSVVTFFFLIHLEVDAADNNKKEFILVSTDWLAEHTNDPSLLILQIGRETEYEKGHIPGAVFFVTKGIYERSASGMDHEIPSVTKLVAVFESLGVSNDSYIVICYENAWAIPSAARAYLTLAYLGMGERTSILDGGLPQWKAEKRPITSEIPTISAGNFTPDKRDNVIVDTEWIRENLRSPKVAIIDARPEAAYTGRYKDKRFSRHGHVTGAFNIPFTELTSEKTPHKFKSVKELEDMFLNFGIKPGSTVVSYCDTGVWASLVYFVAKYLGYDARFYDGSFQEWSADESLPVTGLVKK